MKDFFLKSIGKKITMSVSDTLAWVGTFLILGAYFLNSFGYLSVEHLLYPIMNIVGSLFLGINVYFKKSYAAFFLELVWGAIALFSLFKIWWD